MMLWKSSSNINILCSIKPIHKLRRCTDEQAGRQAQAGPGLMVSGSRPLPPIVQGDLQDLYIQAHPITPTASVKNIYMVIAIRRVQLLTLTASFLKHAFTQRCIISQWDEPGRAELSGLEAGGGLCSRIDGTLDTALCPIDDFEGCFIGILCWHSSLLKGNSGFIQMWMLILWFWPQCLLVIITVWCTHQIKRKTFFFYHILGFICVAMAIVFTVYNDIVLTRVIVNILESGDREK